MPDQPYRDADQPGRRDVNGVEWWASDPYPTWFRYEDGELRTDPARFPDEPVSDDELLGELMEKLWDSLGSGVWLEPDDYEALRERYNELAQAAEDVCTVYRRTHS